MSHGYRLAAAVTVVAAVAGAAAAVPPALLGYVTGVSNPEDLVTLPGTPWVIVSAMRSRDHRGRLLAVDARDPAVVRPLYQAGAAFAPHGLGVRALGGGRFELLVVDHGGGEWIARLGIAVDASGPRVASATRLALPPGTSANGVAALADGGLVMTSMFDPRDPAFVDKLAHEAVTGGVWRWSAAGGWHALARPRLSGANGVTVTRDGATVFASEWAARRIWAIPLDGGEPRATATSFLPDNLRWTAGGQLLVAGQVARPEALFACQDKRPPCPMGYVVAVVDPATLTVRPWVQADQQSFAATGFGGATGALEVGRELWVGSFTGERVARFPAPLR